MLSDKWQQVRSPQACPYATVLSVCSSFSKNVATGRRVHNLIFYNFYLFIRTVLFPVCLELQSISNSFLEVQVIKHKLKSSHSNQDNVVPVKEKTNRSMEQISEPQSRPMQTQSAGPVPKEPRQFNEERGVFSRNSAGAPGHPHAKNESRHCPHIFHKYSLKMDLTSKCKRQKGLRWQGTKSTLTFILGKGSRPLPCGGKSWTGYRATAQAGL